MDRKPKVGDEIYVHSSFYISHGSDDFVGGLCTISRISYEHSYCMVEIEERPGAQYNYEYLLKEQDKLKERFGDQRGHRDPDIDRPWIEEGDIVNGKVYHGPPIW